MNTTINQTIIKKLTFAGQNIPFTTSPTMDIFLMALLAALFLTLVNKYLTDQIRIKALRIEMKELQKNMKKHISKDPQKAKKIQAEIMKKNFENMKHSMNPKIMLITMLPMLILFGFIRKYYSQFGEFFTPFGLVSWSWLGTYIIFSIICSITLKKILDVA